MSAATRGPGPGALDGRRRLLFVSDCHVSPEAPGPTRRFLGFCAALAAPARPLGPVSTLFLLGDLFDYWIGPAHPFRPDHHEVLAALRGVVQAGIEVRFLHGNRDFLAGPELALATGAVVVGDQEVLDLEGRRVLLFHGDVLCTHDTRYLAWRRLVRAAPVRDLARALPEPVIARIARGVRGASRRIGATPTAAAARALVPEAAVRLFRRARLDAAVCGHAHLPGRLDLRIDGAVRPLYILGDWDGPATYLEYVNREFAFRTFA